MNLSARIQDVTKNSNATAVMMQLRYWFMKAKPKGREETAQSMAGLAAQTKLSFDQVKRAVAKLRASGLIRTEQHLFATKNGSRNFNSFRLTAKGDELCFALPAKVEPAPPEQCNSAPLFQDYENTTKKYNYEKMPQHPPGASEPEVLPFFPVSSPTPHTPPSQNPEDDMKPTHSVHDVPGMIAAKKKMHQPDSLAALAEVWQIGMKEHVPNKLIQLTGQDKGKLKHFVAHCEPGTSAAVLALVMANWIAYTKFCEQEAGAFKTPATPVLGFVVKFAQQAVTFFLQKQPKPDTKPELPALKPASAQLIAGQEPAPGLATMEDVLAPIDPNAALKGGSC